MSDPELEEDERILASLYLRDKGEKLGAIAKRLGLGGATYLRKLHASIKAELERTER